MNIAIIILAALLVVAAAVIAWVISKRNECLQKLSAYEQEKNGMIETTEILRKEISNRDAAIAAGQASIAVLDSQVGEARKQLDKYNEQIQLLNERIITLSTENSKYNERLTVAASEKERLQREAQLQFNELATKIFDDKARKSDDRLNEILNPLKG